MFHRLCKVACAALLCSPAALASGSLQQDITQTIQRHGVNIAEIAVCVDELSSHVVKPSVAINSDQLMTPASLTKIITAYTLLKQFSPDYRIETRLMTLAEQQHDVLKGDLYFIGAGDPTFVSESMWQLVNNLYRSGIRDIQGDLIIDNTLYPAEVFEAFSDSHRAYQALTNAASFNWNSLTLYFDIDAQQQLSIHADPDVDWIEIDNQLELKSGKQKNIQISSLYTAQHLKLTIKGQLGLQHKHLVQYRSIEQPALWTGYQLKAFLAQRGIQVKGQVRLGQMATSANAHTVASYQSDNIAHIVKLMMKYSNNFIAKMMTLRLAVDKGYKAATEAQGIAIIKQQLTQLNTSKSDFKLYDPAGLSKANKVSCRLLNDVQWSIWKDPNMAPEYITALPVAGFDGTMKRRFKQYQGYWIRAKTGLLSGAVGLAGFAALPDGQPIAFTMIYNGHRKLPYQVQQLFDEILLQVIQSSK